MMGYNELANQDLNLGDPFKGGRKLRPLVPRPFLSSPSNHNVNNSCLTGFHNPTNHLLSLNNTTRHQHHFVGSDTAGKDAVGAHQVMVSSRWNPTPEQLRALEELYRRGTRTPSAEQIQHITAQLRHYGKIEGKNVFYWFQNHKARERQKRRRQLQLPPPPSSGSTTSGNRIGFEAEQKSYKWAPSSTNKEDSDPPIQIAEAEAEAGLTKAETTNNTSDNGLIQFHETPEFQHNHNTNNNNNNDSNITTNIFPGGRNLLFAGERNFTWQTHHNNNNNNSIMVQPSSCSCCYPSPPPSLPFSLSSIIMSKELSQPLAKHVNNGVGGDRSGKRPPSPTLQLFPVAVTNDDQRHNNNNDDDDNVVTMNKEEEDDRDNNSCVTNDEKATNSPFPYYQFL